MNETVPIYISQPSAGSTLIKVGVVGFAIWYGRKKWLEYQKNKAEDSAGTNTNEQLALAIHQAVDGAGTDENLLWDTAAKIKDWEGVSKSYRETYHTSMLDDIKGDLSPSDFQRFMNIYNLSQRTADGRPVGGKNTITRGLAVITEKETWLRKTPVYIKVVPKELDPLGLLKGNAIALVPAQKVLGVATGRFSDDLKSPDATRYIEVAMGAFTEKGGQIVNVWVASSQVRTEAKKLTSYPKSQIVTLSKSAASFALSGPEDSEEKDNIQVITKGSLSFVYLPDFTYHDYQERPDVVLGYYLSKVKDSEGREFIKFRTIQGMTRLTEAEGVDLKIEVQ